MFILEKKIQHYVGLEDYDLDYINTECNEHDKTRFINAYNHVMKNLQEFIKKHPEDFPQIIKHKSFYKIDKMTSTASQIQSHTRRHYVENDNSFDASHKIS